MNIPAFFKWLLKPRRAPVRASGMKPGPWAIPDLAPIKRYEGLRLRAYMPTPNDVPTIGWGHTKDVWMGQEISIPEAQELLEQDVAWVKRVIDGAVEVPLGPNQVSALYSFVFNLGGSNFRSSTLLRKLNAGDYVGAANEFKRWNKQKGTVLRGLVHRRAHEAVVFRKDI
jgi:lysozyme